MLPQSASTLLIAAGLAGALFLLLRRRSATGWVERNADLRDNSAPAFFRLPPADPSTNRQTPDALRELNGQLAEQLVALQNLIALARRESDRLEAAIRRAEQLALAPTAAVDGPAPLHSLARIESLADPASLADPNFLAAAAASLAPSAAKSPPLIDADLFTTNRHALDLSRLADQGLSPAEISHRLSLPLGEVELLLSLRPV